MFDCLFCKIINKKIPTETIYEDSLILAFKDINPQAKFHILVVPKKHIESINFIEKKDRKLISDLFFVIKKITKNNNIEHYKLQINTGRKAGQIIDHLHIHILAS